MRQIMDFLGNLIKKFKNWNTTKNCRANNHILGTYKVISTSEVSGWEEPRGGQQMRVVCYKVACNKCNTIYLLNNRWEFRNCAEF